ncbi:NADH-quinone oxidoreductase subunit NuoN [Sulfuritalea hydrogenivorans]|jgi:NADH-quinone oxidoreductase subunit N|uniref:NADH-quinone oxidoreductase subunit N n=1 Tax=Sulfuritalea hydrogenivorans sk43H TaxID=1223802 RepID=W0SEI6_9PROT|nr:NADH-quinone oxidoreductase subunit NuoN [Sulfuritalea hydrogenivorans]MDK9713193.1 NADH-quinone oxidoreductase subunit NuoN [Sulfuritalea sp.]BAO29190.1 NADH dehydrogenase subunit N [Sulfuritalea hydrogenivorans sk43H]
MLNNFVMPDLYPAAPEIFLLLMSFLVLFVDLIFGATHRWMTAMLTVITLLGCAAITLVTSDGQTTLTFANMFVDDLLSDFLKLMTYLAVIMMLVYSRQYLADRGLDKGEFYLLVLYATLGMMVMISAANFLTMYLGLELMSLSLYGLVAIDRDSKRATEAAMKYFTLGALASGLLLYGMSMIYGATGSLEIEGVAQALYHGQSEKTVLVFGLVFLVAGIAFKLGLVPFHMWIPDVYHGAPTAVTMFIGSAPKFAAFAMALRLLVYALLGLAVDWQKMLLIMAVLSIGLGNLAAIAQTNIKRMLAYSAISHMGYMVLGLMSGVVGGQIDAFTAINAYSSALYYTVAYVLMSLGAFGMVLLLSRAGYEAENLEDFKGLNKRSPWFAAMMLIIMFSMAGIPFFIGFFAKFAVLLAAIKAGYTAVAVIAVMFSLVGAFFYLRVVKLMYFDTPVDSAPITAGLDLRVLLSLNGLAVAGFGLFPDAVMMVCTTTLMRSL